MLTVREYSFCHKVASGVDRELAYKSAFGCRKDQMLVELPVLWARADIHMMLDFITGELGKYDDETTRIVKLRQSIYQRLSEEPSPLKPSEYAALTKEYTRLSGELVKLQRREEEAGEDIDSLMKDLKKFKIPELGEEVVSHEVQENEEDGQGREEVLGDSILDEVLS